MNPQVYDIFNGLTFFSFERKLDEYCRATDIFSINGSSKLEGGAKSIFECLGIIPRKEVPDRLCKHIIESPNRPIRQCQQRLHIENRTDYKLGWRWACNSRGGCRMTYSPLENTWFEQSRLDYQDVLKLIFCFNEHMPRKYVIRHIASWEMNMSPTTVTYWYNFCKGVCEKIVEAVQEPIDGPGVFVELDESHLWTNKYHRGRILAGQRYSMWVFGGVEADNNRNYEDASDPDDDDDDIEDE